MNHHLSPYPFPAPAANKPSPAVVSAETEAENAAGANRKRRWGSSTAVTAKKPSISITTDSLKVRMEP